MSEYCFAGNVFICYLVISITCLACAMADLIGRFKSGNKINTILFGNPQYIFYMLNVGAGVLTLFSSEAIGSTHLFTTVFSNLPQTIVKVSALGLATFVGIRSTVSTLITSGGGQKLEIGPGRLFAALVENIEFRIDQNRMVKATKEISTIAPSLSPRAVLNVVLPYCFGQAEKDSGNRETITSELEAICSGERNIYEEERSALMLSHLHKVFGLSVLESAIELVTKDPSIVEGEKNLPPNIVKPMANKLQLTDAELEEAFNKLTGNSNTGAK